MSFYRGYKGQCAGRVLYGLDIYCNTYHRLCEYAQIGDGTVEYHRKVVAYFEWEGNIPKFTFTDSLNTHDSNIRERFEEAQFRRFPYFDDWMVLDYVDYVIQEVRKSLTFDEALAIKHVRDFFKGEWNDITVQKPTIDKIIETIGNSSHGYLKEKAPQMWQHIALCAIYCI